MGHPPRGQREHGGRRAHARHRARQGPARPIRSSPSAAPGPCTAGEVATHPEGAAHHPALRRRGHVGLRAPGRAARRSTSCAPRASGSTRADWAHDQPRSSPRWKREGRALLRARRRGGARRRRRAHRRDALRWARGTRSRPRCRRQLSAASLATITRQLRGGVSRALPPLAAGRADRGAELARDRVRRPGPRLNAAPADRAGAGRRARRAGEGARAGRTSRSAAASSTTPVLRPLRPRPGHDADGPGDRRGARVRPPSSARGAPRADGRTRRAGIWSAVRSACALRSAHRWTLITLEICWNRLRRRRQRAGGGARCARRSRSIVREAGDLSAGVFDRRGFMVAQAVTGTPGHINSMALGDEALPGRLPARDARARRRAASPTIRGRRRAI